MPYAITLGLDRASAARIENLWGLLDDAGLSRSMPQLGYTPHLTLAEDLASAMAAHAMELLATSWQPFTARIDCLDLVSFRPVEILWRQTLEHFIF